jgi:hypothetical protein
MTFDLKRLLGESRVPSPPAVLRDRTIRAALGASERRWTDDRWSQMWHSRPLRYAWAATVGCLVLAHVLIPAAPRSSPPEPRSFAVHQASELTDDEIRGIAAVLRLDLDSRSLSDSLRLAAASDIAGRSKAPDTKESTS